MNVYDMCDYDIRSLKGRIHQVLVPVGSLEQHGEHLPVSTDSVIIECIARTVSKRIPSLVLPTIIYGVSSEHKPLFNISLRNSTLSKMLSEICVSVCENEFTKIVILNGHHGNMGLLQYIPQNVAGIISNECAIQTINYWQLLDKAFDHAGHIETSLMLAIKPELVNMRKARKGSEINTLFGTVTSSILNGPNSFVKIAKNGIIGNPLGASPVEGKKLLKNITAGIIRAIHQFNSLSKK